MPACVLPCTLLAPLPAQVLQQLRTTFSNGFGLPPYQSAAQQEAEVEATWQAAKAAEAAAQQQAEAEEAAKQALLAKYMPYQVGLGLLDSRCSVCTCLNVCGSSGLTGVDQHQPCGFDAAGLTTDLPMLWYALCRAVLCCATAVAAPQAYTPQYLEQQRRERTLASHRRTKQQAFWLSLGLALGSSAYRWAAAAAA